MKTVITDNGINACLEAGMLGPKIEVVKVKIGSQIIDVSPDMTDVAGEVWSGGTAYITYQVQESDLFAFKITLDEAVGDFDVGNIGLYLEDGTLFSITSMDKPERKIKNAEDVIGNRKIFVIPIKLAGISELISTTLIVPDEASIPFVQTQNDLPQVNMAAYSVYEVLNHTDYNSSALALRTPTTWIYISASGNSNYAFPATMFDDDAEVGFGVYYDVNSVMFKASDGLNDSKGFLGIRTVYNTIASSGVYHNDDYHLNPGSYYYADGNANAGRFTETANNAPVGYAVTSKVIVVGAKPETINNKTQNISINNPTTYKYPSESAVVNYSADMNLIKTRLISDCCINAPSGVASYSGLTITLPANYRVLFCNGRDSDNKLKNIDYTTTSNLTVNLSSTADDYSVLLRLNGSTPSLVAVKTSILKYEPGSYTGTYYRKDLNTNMWYYKTSSTSETQVTVFVVWQGLVQNSAVAQPNPTYPVNLLTGVGIGGGGGSIETTLVNVATESAFKQMVIDWMMPNFSSALNISSGWTATKSGWIMVSRGYTAAGAYAYVDGVKVWDSTTFDACYGADFFPIPKGGKFTCSNCDAAKFYPCKGW